MTTLLSPARVDFARSVKNSAAVLIVMILINQEHPGHSTTADEIRDIIEMDVRTIGNHLRSLSARNLALYDGRGYVLIKENAMILGNEALALSPAATQALAPEAQALATPKFQDTQLLEADARTVCALEVEDSLLILKKDSSSTTYLRTNCAQQLTAIRVFKASGQLFGEPVFVIANVPTTRALSVFAHVYDLQSGRMPARVAWSMLRDEKEAREEYIANPWLYFPDEFLEALGVVHYRCDACQLEELFETRAALQAHVQATHPLMAICPTCSAYFETTDAMDAHFEAKHESRRVLPDESVTVCLQEGRAMSAAQAWQAVLGQLQVEMPKASFETWVRDTKPVRFDGNTLTIGVRNAYAQDWLESRLASTVQRLLIGILAMEIKVEFIVAEVDDE